MILVIEKAYEEIIEKVSVAGENGDILWESAKTEWKRSSADNELQRLSPQPANRAHRNVKGSWRGHCCLRCILLCKYYTTHYNSRSMDWLVCGNTHASFFRNTATVEDINHVVSSQSFNFYACNVWFVFWNNLYGYVNEHRNTDHPGYRSIVLCMQNLLDKDNLGHWYPLTEPSQAEGLVIPLRISDYSPRGGS